MVEIHQIESLMFTNRVTIPEDYLDEMGHMNIMYYLHIYDRAAWTMFGQFGLSLDYMQAHDSGMFALKQFVQYLAEVRVGETVSVYSRVLGVGAKRVHFMHFMVNDTTNTLASTLEVLGSFADLNVRRTAPFPDAIRQQIEALSAEHNQLAWDAPVCGVLSV